MHPSRASGTATRPEAIRRAGLAQALIFDCDGTLALSGPAYGAAWADAFLLAGQKMDQSWFHERSGLSEKAFLKAFEVHHDVLLDRDLIVAAVHKAFLAHIGTIAENPQITGIVRAFHGIKLLAVASNGPRTLVLATLRQLDLLHLFDAVVTLDDVDAPKPSPEIFITASRTIACSPQDCLVFEDSDQGLVAAKSGGFEAIDIRHWPVGKT